MPDEHYLVKTLKDAKYKDAIERLCALRNFAAHSSPQAKKAALKAVKQKGIGSSDWWLQRQGRFEEIAKNLKELVKEASDGAPR